LNIGAGPGAPAAPGTLNAAEVAFGAGAGTINFNHTATAYEFAPVISGSGAVNVLAGTTTLSATSNGYTGPTTVNGGAALFVDGSIANSSVTVNNGATLGGTGTVGPTVINSGGFLAPGHQPGTMTVNGNLTLQTGAFYVVQVNPATASNTHVEGNATINPGSTVSAVFSQVGGYVTKSYPILTADGTLVGRFDVFETTHLPAGFGARVNYIGNTAFLTLRAHLVPEPPPPGPGTEPTVPPPLIPHVPGLPPSEQPSPPDQPTAGPRPIF